MTITVDDALKHMVRKGGAYEFSKNIYQENDDADYFGMNDANNEKAAVTVLTSSQGTSTEK